MESKNKLFNILFGAACVVIVAWGIRSASHIISLVLISLLLAYAIFPLPQWLMQRFHLRHGAAIVVVVLCVITLHIIFSLALVEAGGQMKEKLSFYESRLQSIEERTDAFLSQHGHIASHASVQALVNTKRIMNWVGEALPGVISVFSDRIIVWLLTLLFLVKLLDSEQTGEMGKHLTYFGGDVQRYIAASAKSGAINALANVAIYFALGVEYPVLWGIVYFFLHFIPNVGFVIALLPPLVLTLLVAGWKHMIVVLVCVFVVQMLTDYVIQPIFMRKSLEISLFEVTLSLLVWGFLLGAAGTILAVPLTIAARKFLQNLAGQEAAMALGAG